MNSILELYSDGSCLNNPGPGGWAFLIIFNDKKNIHYGFDKTSTNNKMEIIAANNGIIESINVLKLNGFNSGGINVYTDSKYVQTGITEWIVNWKKNNWKTANKKPVKNKEMWGNLDFINQQTDYKITWKWVEAHAGNKYNEVVDKYARYAATNQVSGCRDI